MARKEKESGKKVLTMPEYIKRETAIKAIMNDAPEQVGYSREDAADCIRYMDAADVAPVVHGRCVKIYENGEHAIDQHQVGVFCSHCTKMPKDKFTESVFCPNCGAKMDGERKENENV